MTILERNTSFSDKETLEQSYWHSNFPFTVDKLSTHPYCSRNSWQPSRWLVSVLHSLVSCILPRLLSFLGRHYSSGLRFRSKTAYSVMIFMSPNLHCKYTKYSVWIPLRNTQIFERKRNLLSRVLYLVEGTRTFTRPIFPVWQKMVWERDYSLVLDLCMTVIRMWLIEQPLATE